MESQVTELTRLDQSIKAIGPTIRTLRCNAPFVGRYSESRNTAASSGPLSYRDTALC